MPCTKLIEYLEDQGVSFQLVEHPRAYTAPLVASKLGVTGRAFAKTVMVKLDGEMAMAVVSAEHKVNFTLLREAAGAVTASLALEEEFQDRFPDCELGAMPPFGHLYGLPVHVDRHVLESEELSFNAGSHTEVITLATSDFVRLVEPCVADFTFRQVQEFHGLM